MKKNPRLALLVILLLTFACALVDLPRFDLKINWGPVKFDQSIGGYNIDFSLGGRRFYKDLSIRQGLDLQGGVRVVYQADMSGLEGADRSPALDALRQNIQRRVDLYGVAEPVVQTAKVGDSYRIIVELPGVTDVAQALEIIGKTARLEFKRQNPEILSSGGDQEELSADELFVKTDITGADLARAFVSFDQTTGEPQIGFEMTSEGGEKFEALTKEIQGQPLAIYLDGRLVSAPIVQSSIRDRGRITGDFSLEEANNLAIQLNAGALPVPIEKLEQRNIGPTLGQESVTKSLRAGLLGLGMVAIFMVVYYGRLGLLADVALFIYGLLTLALYKFIPVTLTLAGISGFILSIGMAVDSNILIFERIREELARGSARNSALETGFGRGWDDIKDANVCTLIACFVLFNPFGWSFLHTSGMVRGFALTLFIGVIVSLFTGVVVTRTLVRLFYKKQ